MIHEAQNLSFSNEIPPKLEDVKSYFSYLNISEAEAEVFFFYYQGMDWKNETGTPIWDWMVAVDKWVWNLEN